MAGLELDRWWPSIVPSLHGLLTKSALRRPSRHSSPIYRRGTAFRSGSERSRLKPKVLGLAETKISGGLPYSLGELKKLQVLSLYTAMLSGEISLEIGNCSELVGLYLYENSLSGSIPWELGKLLKLEKLLLWQNNFVGSIPGEIGNCRILVILDVSSNFLTGNRVTSFCKSEAK